MKFLKKHKLLSFAVISFITLSGVNFYMIFEIVKIIRKYIEMNSRTRGTVLKVSKCEQKGYKQAKRQIKKYALH